MNYLNKKKPDIETWDRVANYYNSEITESEFFLADQLLNILDNINIKPGASLIELGSGSGHISGLLNKAGYKVTLLDFSEVALEQAKDFFASQGFNGEFIHGDITKLDSLELQQYDVVWNSGVLEHFDNENLIKIFNGVREKINKYFVFLVPNPESLPYLLYRYKMIHEESWPYGKEYLRRDYSKLLSLTGFEIIDELYIGDLYMIDHMNSVYGEQNNHLFNELVEKGLVPEKNNYLKVFIASLQRDYKEVDIHSSLSNVAEFETFRFDMLAKTSGILHQLNQEKEKNDTLKYENKILHTKINHLEEVRQQLESKNSKQETCINSQNDLLNNLTIELQKIKEESSRVKEESNEVKELFKDKDYEVAYLNSVLHEKESRISEIYNSRFWKVAKKYYHLRDRSLISKFFKTLKNEGIRATFIKTKTKLRKFLIKIRYRNENVYTLKCILKEHKGKPIIVFHPLLDWNIPLFQRPQHIAHRLAEEGYLYFYCTINAYDNVQGFKQYDKSDSLYITDQYELLLKKIDKKIMHFYAQDSRVSIETINDSLNRGDIVLYEYLDALHEDLCTSKNNVIERHEYVLKNENCIVITTADRLYKEVAKYRTTNLKLVTNGVEFSHFRRKISEGDLPDVVRNLKEKNKPIIGYFGALAKWFDYDLVLKLAVERPEYEILLIGWNYDGSLTSYNFEKYSNITIVGPINYQELPLYASCFDVSTIPFVLNEITEATSPIKLFEYMALGKPIVTSNLPECRKYQSVLIGETHEKFIEMVDYALSIRGDEEYQVTITNDAKSNTWEQKAKDIAGLLGYQKT